MPSLTQNYNLKKPLGTEKVDVNVLNENFDIIDSELKKTIDNASETFINKEDGLGLCNMRNIDVSHEAYNIGDSQTQNEYVNLQCTNQAGIVVQEKILLSDNNYTDEDKAKVYHTNKISLFLLSSAGNYINKDLTIEENTQYILKIPNGYENTRYLSALTFDTKNINFIDLHFVSNIDMSTHALIEDYGYSTTDTSKFTYLLVLALNKIHYTQSDSIGKETDYFDFMVINGYTTN